jgi:hypothetical protein
VHPIKDLKCNPISLAFQNIPSMASGCDFWKGSYKHAIKEVRFEVRVGVRVRVRVRVT